MVMSAYLGSDGISARIETDKFVFGASDATFMDAKLCWSCEILGYICVLGVLNISLIV